MSALHATRLLHSRLGKPYEGELHVRFDEGARETDHRPAQPGHSPERGETARVAGPHPVPGHRSTLQLRNLVAKAPAHLRVELPGDYTGA
jgi:hypothetical protein